MCISSREWYVIHFDLYKIIRQTVFNNMGFSKIIVPGCKLRYWWYVRFHEDVIKWKHFPRYCSFVRIIHRSLHKGQWRGALMFSLICVWINGWENNREAGDLICYCAHYDVIVMLWATPNVANVYSESSYVYTTFWTTKNSIHFCNVFT